MKMQNKSKFFFEYIKNRAASREFSPKNELVVFSCPKEHLLYHCAHWAQ